MKALDGTLEIVFGALERVLEGALDGASECIIVGALDGTFDNELDLEGALDILLMQ